MRFSAFLIMVLPMSALTIADSILRAQKFSSEVDLTNSRYSLSTLHKCIAAPNCDVYNGPEGASIHFMPGMEPGSQDYADRFSNGSVPLSKTMRPYSRASRVSETTAAEIHTDITFGDSSINYGIINPSDAVHHLYDVCKFSACDPTTQYQVDTQVICRFGQNSFPCGKTLSLHADGQYDGWEERNHYVDAIVAAFSQGQTWKQEFWRSCNAGGAEKDCDSGEIWTGRQSNFISVENFDSAGSLHGHMSVSVVMDPADGGACAAITAVGGAVLKAVNPIAGSLFGLFKGFCGGSQFF